MWVQSDRTRWASKTVQPSAGMTDCRGASERTERQHGLRATAFHKQSYRNFDPGQAKAPELAIRGLACGRIDNLGAVSGPQALILRLVRLGVNGCTHESAPAEGSLRTLGQGVSCVRQNTAMG